MHALVKKLVERGPVLTDGAWGTQLQARGLAPGEMPDLWNLAHPQKVVEVARAYIKAGSQVILTNTFGSNRIRLRGTEGESKVAELNEAGVQLSRQAAGNRVTVFASMGPTGKLPSAGEISAEELAEAFAEQAEALKRAGADGIVVETMSDLDEARIAVDAARKTGLPVVATDIRGPREQVRDGETGFLVPPMALSRLVLGVHYPSDVLTVVVVGTVVAESVGAVSDRSAKARAAGVKA